MKELTFLRKLRKDKILQLVEPSEEMKSSYLIKAENCLKSARILHQNQIYENSTSEAYYSMYNSLLSLLFNAGIKSENHSASILLLDILFKKKEMAKTLFWAKGERIDKQYYIETQQIVKVTNESCNDMILKAEEFLIKMKLLISEISNESISSVRKEFIDLFG